MLKSSWLLIFLQTERSARQVNPLAYKLTKTQQLPKTLTYKLINSSTYKLINSSTYKLTNSPTQKLKLLSFILQNRSNFHSVLAKI